MPCHTHRIFRIGGDDSAEDGCGVIPQVAVGGIGGVLVQIAATGTETTAEALCMCLYAHQLFGVAHRQRAQQHLVEETEDGGGRADTEREHGQDRDGEDGRFPELAQGEAEIGYQAHRAECNGARRVPSSAKLSCLQSEPKMTTG